MPAVRNMLTLTDREEISRGLAEGLEYKEIARLISRKSPGMWLVMAAVGSTGP
jgi:IS30 family transposase